MNPWPSSDWMAIVSERGVPALSAILLLFFWLLTGALRRARQAADLSDYLEGLVLAAALAGTAVVACFDAVLLLPAPAFIAWALFGALAPALPALRSVTLSPRGQRRLLLAVSLVGTLAVLRSSAQVGAMAIYSKAHSSAQFRLAALLDPANVRIQARYAARQGRRY